MEIDIESWLNDWVEDYRVEVSLVAAGLTRQERQQFLHRLKETIAFELSQQDLPERQRKAEALSLFLATLLGRHLALSSSELVRSSQPRHLTGISAEEAVCLWLGMFRRQTFGLAGLWQLYLDVADPALSLPEIIRQVFQPNCEDEENQDYIERVLEEARQAGLALTDRDTSKIIAWVLQTDAHLGGRDEAQVAGELKSRRSAPVNAVDQHLLRGGNTVLDEFVRRVYHEVDTC